jgi:hypothetical protein
MQLLRSARVFGQQDVALVVVGYSLLWLTVLSPHGASLSNPLWRSAADLTLTTAA